jgi:hypothetical protein
MSDRTREKTAARERVAAMRAAQARAERRRRTLLAAGAVAAVVVLVAGLVVAKVAGLGGSDDTSTTAGDGSGGTAASPAVTKAVSGVPATTFDQVGVGDAQAAPRPIKAPALTEGGKPKVLYVGAEYCPFCAAERWPVVVALSRFGTWSGLGETTSAHDDVYPDTATLSFHGATYTSDYLTFAGYETTTRDRQPLDTLSPADAKTEKTYNTETYVGSNGGIPFLDIAGRYASSGASYNPEVLAGKTQQQIAQALADPASPIAKAVDGSANLLTALVCQATGQQPAPVCTSAGVQQAAQALAGQKGQ